MAYHFQHDHFSTQFQRDHQSRHVPQWNKHLSVHGVSREGSLRVMNKTEYGALQETTDAFVVADRK